MNEQRKDGFRWNRVLLVIHLLLVALWLGGLAAMLLLTLGKKSLPAGEQSFLVDLAVFRIHEQLVLSASLLTVLSGFVFSMFTGWGFFKFRWIALKWAAVSVLFVVITFFMTPAVNVSAALADLEREMAPLDPGYGSSGFRLVAFGVLQLMVLAFLVWLSVFKPWGKIKSQIRVKRWITLLAGSLSALLLILFTVLAKIYLENIRSLEVRDVDPAVLADGVYRGEVNYGAEFIVEVRVRDRRIEGIDLVQCVSNPYADAARGVLNRVVEHQSSAVETVTGATTTSKCLLKAIEAALAQR